MIKIDPANITSCGSRENNEDFYGIQPGTSSYIAVLCDGLGGHNCGEIASQGAAKDLVNGISGLSAITDENLYAVIKKVNDGIVSYQDEHPECAGMRTTAVGCYIDLLKKTIKYFNVGDSRLYIFKNGIMKYMTHDHSVSRLSVDMGQMSFNEIRGDSDRNKLLKVLGGQTDGEKLGTVYDAVEIESGDAFLLCSDGFWEYVLEEEMEADLAKSRTAEQWLDFMTVRLLIRATDTNDNYTAVAGIFVDGSEDNFDVLHCDANSLQEWEQIGTTSMQENIPVTSMKMPTEIPQGDAMPAMAYSSPGRNAYVPEPDRGEKKKLTIEISKQTLIIAACIVGGILAVLGVTLGIRHIVSNSRLVDDATVIEQTQAAEIVTTTLVAGDGTEFGESAIRSFTDGDVLYVSVWDMISAMEQSDSNTDDGSVIKMQFAGKELEFDKEKSFVTVTEESGQTFNTYEMRNETIPGAGDVLFMKVDDLSQILGLTFDVGDGVITVSANDEYVELEGDGNE